MWIELADGNYGLMAEKDIRLNKLSSIFIDGIPLDMASSLLGGKGGLFARMHISMHAKSINNHKEDGKVHSKKQMVKLTKKQHLALVEDLIRGIEKLSIKGVKTEWGDYYEHTNYSEEAAANKGIILKNYIDEIKPHFVWDMGANDGTYSKIAINSGAEVVAFDIDPIATDLNYHESKKNGIPMLPLVLDAANPSPSIGFANKERKKLADRHMPDCVMALAFVHHMAISNNIPLDMLAEWFSIFGRFLIIEFVPKTDSQVQILLSTRKDIFPDYNIECFERAFSTYYEMRRKCIIPGTERVLYLWEIKNND